MSFGFKILPFKINVFLSFAKSLISSNFFWDPVQGFSKNTWFVGTLLERLCDFRVFQVLITFWSIAHGALEFRRCFFRELNDFLTFG